jgi:hypothetical protein
VLIVNGAGVVLDSAMANALVRSAATPHRALRYRRGQALITLRPRHGGTYDVRVVVRGLATANADLPLVSASLQVGSTVFTDSLSCARPRGHRVVCRG